MKIKIILTSILISSLITAVTVNANDSFSVKTGNVCPLDHKISLAWFIPESGGYVGEYFEPQDGWELTSTPLGEALSEVIKRFTCTLNQNCYSILADLDGDTVIGIQDYTQLITLWKDDPNVVGNWGFVEEIGIFELGETVNISNNIFNPNRHLFQACVPNKSLKYFEWMKIKYIGPMERINND